MNAMADPTKCPAQLTAFQRECIHIFVRAAQALSIPRSIGEIYGLLYSSREPMALDDVVEALNISKGSASQGLRWLREIGALRPSYIPGDRRDHFVAETELRKLIFGFLRESVEPHLKRAAEYLEHAEATISEVPVGEERKFAQERIKKLYRWRRFATQALPLFLRVVEKF
jgi:DNA-binding transcriptional regulator GbsR (MarR family)